MRRTIVPIALVLSAVALFITFIDPTYKEVKAIGQEVKNYDEALSKSKELQAIRDTLLSRYNTFAEDDLKRLELLLPDTVDNIRLVLDIDTIASRYGMVIKDLKLASSLPTKNSFDPKGEDIKSVDLTFSVSTEYDTFLKFIRDLEDSLRIVDVTRIELNSDNKIVPSYTITIRTYWLP